MGKRRDQASRKDADYRVSTGYTNVTATLRRRGYCPLPWVNKMLLSLAYTSKQESRIVCTVTAQQGDT